MEETAHKNIVPEVVKDWPDEETEQDRKQYIVAQRIAQLKPHQFQPGKSYNPGGRPKGMSMKQWMRQYLASLTDEERIAYFQGIDKLDLWRMAEGNPSEDKNIKITVPQPILGGITQLDNSLDTPYNTPEASTLG